jgi:hypothetical protein
MKTFLTIMAVAIFGLFLYIGYSYFSFFGADKVLEGTDLVGIEESIVDTANEETMSVENVETESDTPSMPSDSEPVSPTINIMQPGQTIKRGENGYYLYNKSTIKVRILNVGKARDELSALVKTDIPESTPLTIWTIIFEQQFAEGKEIYGSYAGFNLFGVQGSDGGPAYILNSTGDYSGCPAQSSFKEDFERKTPYSQCFIIGSNSEPNLIFVGEPGSVYASNPAVFK